MQVFKNIENIPNLSIALGFFDGVHKGHQAVIKNAVNFAKANNTKSAVITFKDHPHCYFHGVCPKYILTRNDREKKIAECGIDYLFELNFNEQLCSLDADEYLRDILIKNFSPVAITTGFNHFFGANKSGNTDFLSKMQEKYNYKYFKIPPQKYNDETISSTIIRKYLADGNISQANNMLGYKFSISGTVIQGQKLGRTIGFRTANLNYPNELIDLPFGVYSTEVKHKNNTYKGISNFGIRPTVSSTHKHSLETHIINFNKDIYGDEITINFNKMIRAEKKFNSLDALKTQIKKDINSI